jgi:VWFA-related protein
MRVRPWVFTIFIGVVIQGEGPAKAGPYDYSAPSQEPQPTFRTDANYVRVDVYPTQNGAPLTDLQKDDFEIVEEGAPQTIDAFEHVLVTGGVPQDLRREPTSVADSRAMLENPRARVFVLFLDYYHVDVAGSRNMRETLVNALDRFLGPEDLFAVMTPEMSARDLSFARKTTTTRGMLEKYWTWGERDQLVSNDPQDEQYRQCYPAFDPKPGCIGDQGIAEEMIERRREKLTMDALEDLVRYLRGAREERKAILVLSNGWRLFRPNQTLSRTANCTPPSPLPPAGVDPRTGRITTGTATGRPESTQAACDIDRMRLAQIDNDQEFRDIRQEANRSNVAFYPIDPRGLTPFDEPIAKPGQAGGLAPVTAPSVDRARLRTRLESLRVLAADTDGLAIVETNQLERGFQRIVADLSSYYLLGYYSDRRMDGRFHTIRVRVKRPGVQVRARAGYLSPSAAEVSAAAARAKADAAAPLDTAALEARAVEAALAPISSQVRERSVYVQAIAGWRPGGSASVWAVGEVSNASTWKAGADVDVMLVGKGGETLDARRVEVPAGTRYFSAALAPPTGLEPGDYTVNVRARGRALDVGPISASLSVSLRAAPLASDALLVRRGVTTGNREVRTADVRFRRTEQVGLDLPSTAGEAGQARLLGPNGQPLPLPVTVAVRDDPDGSRWHTARVSLAPLAPGDYVLEMTTGSERKLVGFRIVP